MAIWGEKVYVPAIMGASGITKEQAKTCFYYAIATFLLPARINRMPLLVIMGPQGTGHCLRNHVPGLEPSLRYGLPVARRHE